MATAKKTTTTSTAKKVAKTAAKAAVATAAAKKAAEKKTTAKKTTTAKKSTTGSSVKVTATEKKLLELYRAADADTKKAAMALLKGEKSQLSGILDEILKNKAIMNTVTSLFGK